jgi:hypothetical protein
MKLIKTLIQLPVFLFLFVVHGFVLAVELLAIFICEKLDGVTNEK